MMPLNMQPAEKQVGLPGSPSDRQGQWLDVVGIWKTIQGEGPYAGERAVFIRLGGCNLQCPACDTDYTSNRIEIRIDSIMEEVKSLMRSGLVVLTGGEPMRQPIGPLITMLRKEGYKVQIETNGTLFRPELPYLTFHIVCSPKTAKISEELEPYIQTFKYVAAADDINENDGLPNHALGMSCGVARPTGSQANVFLQPLDEQDPEKNQRNTKAVVDSCLKHGYRLCLQLHKIVGLD